MKILLIPDRLMFNRNSNRSHFYGLYYNRKYRKYNAVQLTHIANRDNVRYAQVRNGTIKAVRIKNLDPHADSGVKKANFISDINGNPINKNIGRVIVNRVSTSTSNKIKQFGTDLYSSGRKI